MKAITYQIRLIEPALVTQLDGDPNSAVAFDYVPGSVLRGVFVRQYLNTHLGIDPAVDAESRRWFFSGETRWLNAYPLDRFDKRSLPAPRSMHRDKDGYENEIFDLAVPESLPTEEFRPKWDRVSNPFGQIAGDKFLLIQPRRRISVHTARTRRFGRARSEEQKIDKDKGDTLGAVYRYDALAAGEIFAAIVLCPDNDAAKIKQLLDEAAEQTVKIGKAQTGGYGQAKIEQVSNPKATWEEYAWPKFLKPAAAVAPPQPFSGPLIVTLLSDALLRDEATGQFTVEAEALCQLLSARLGGSLKCKSAFLGCAVFGGFNRKWGLPLPQTQALAAGSVITFEASDIAPQKTIALLEQGVGERRAEGFGRLAFNWQSTPKFREDKTRSEPPTPEVNLVGASEEDLARRVGARILRQRLERRVTATGLKFSVAKPPHKSQLARMRGLAQEELMKLEPSLSRVVEFIDGLEHRKNTRKQFDSAKVSNQKFDKWLLDQLGKTGENDWRNFFCDSGDYPAVQLGGLTIQPTEQMRREYLLRWLVAFLTRAAKQKGDE